MVGAVLAGAALVALIMWLERHSDATLGRWASIAAVVSAALAVPTLIVGLRPMINRRGPSSDEAKVTHLNAGQETPAITIQDSEYASTPTKTSETNDSAHGHSIEPAKLAKAGSEDARILIFPNRNQKLWTELVEILRQVEFDDSDWRMLAAKTGALQDRIVLEYPPHPTADREIKGYLKDLGQTLSEVLKPSATPAQLHAACSDADRIRGWLLDLLHEPR